MIAALVDGVYDGETTVETLLARGDFGLGTFDALDGEMVILDGVCYRLTDDGRASVADAGDRTPYAVVTRFATHVRARIDQPLSRAAVTALIDRRLPSANYMYAVRVDGHFTSMRVRAVHEQHRPYPSLVAATAEEVTTTFTDVAGTVVGFRTPAFEQGLAVPGYHAHFLRADRTGGGHVLDYELAAGDIRICIGTDLHLELPRSPDFAHADLDPDDLQQQIDRAES